MPRRLTGRFKITGVERDERIKKTIDVLTFARTRSDGNHRDT